MRINKEGTASILIVFAFLVFLNSVVYYATKNTLITGGLLIISIAFFIFIVRFFRYPIRDTPQVADNDIICPCDGKVVVIEKVHEPEFFKDERIQVSVFMSPNNVHVNWMPLEGIIKYVKYHAGKYLVAWHPKSSTENERTSIVVENKNGVAVLCRQIAGALARRIVYYVDVNQSIRRGDEMGFIKFGSRVDLFLPLNTNINVKIDDVVQGNTTIIGNV